MRAERTNVAEKASHTRRHHVLPLMMGLLIVALVLAMAYLVTQQRPATAALELDASTIGIGEKQITAPSDAASVSSDRLIGKESALVNDVLVEDVAPETSRDVSAVRTIDAPEPDPVVVLTAIDESNPRAVAAAEQVGTMDPHPLAKHVLPDVEDGWSAGSASAYSIADNDDGKGNYNTTATASGRALTNYELTVAVPESESWRLGQPVAVWYGDMVIVATVTDTGGFAPYGRDLDLAPGVWQLFGASSVDNWGVRTVYYKFL